MVRDAFSCKQQKTQPRVASTIGRVIVYIMLSPIYAVIVLVQNINDDINEVRVTVVATFRAISPSPMTSVCKGRRHRETRRWEVSFY